MNPEIKAIPAKTLVGKRLQMSLLENRTAALWGSFMPLRNEIRNRVSSHLLSLQNYDPSYFVNFDPSRQFEKWAAVEVSSIEAIPEGLESLILPGGMYAVFHYKGMSNDPKIFQDIFTKWLPQSGYALDDRPHFEVLGAKYKNNDPSSEEEIWIPIKRKP